MSYLGDGVTKQFSVPFPYLKAEDMRVAVNFVDVPFTMPSAGIVALETAPEAGVEIKVYRETDISELPVEYTDGSILLASDMNHEATHNLYVCQEVYDKANDVYSDAQVTVEALQRIISVELEVNEKAEEVEAARQECIEYAGGLYNNLDAIRANANNILAIEAIASDLNAEYVDSLDCGYVDEAISGIAVPSQGYIKAIYDMRENIQRIVDNLDSILAAVASIQEVESTNYEQIASEV